MSPDRLDQYKGSLTPAQVASGMNVASKNARRLADDASHLLNSGRFPTAAALAVLSIEESGKVSILRRIATATDANEAKEIWREYRRHTQKNVAWPVPALMRSGARQLEQFRHLFEDDADHPRLLENLKQLALYSDCLGEARWADPAEVIDGALAHSLVQTANILAPDRDVSVKEIELWVKYLGPVKNRPMQWQKKALLEWHRECVDGGLKEDTPLDAEAFFLGHDPVEPQ